MATRSNVTAMFLVLLTATFFVSLTAEAVYCKLTFGNRSSVDQAIQLYRKVFKAEKPIIGMIHLAGKFDDVVVARALRELSLFEKHGVHAAIIENYHGRTYQVEMVLKAAQRKFPNLVLGINILPNEYALAFRLARKYGAKFIQLDFVAGRYYGGPDGITQMDYKDYLAYRNKYSDILVLGGVHPKYYEPVFRSDLTEDIRTAQWVADAVVVTGEGTGKATPLEKIEQFRNILGHNFPLVIGAGLTAENAAEQLPYGDGAIIGSYFKDGETKNQMIPERIISMKRIFDQYEGVSTP